MGGGIAKGVAVRVTGVSSWERGKQGIVKDIRSEWGVKQAVVVVPGRLRSEEITVLVTDLSTA